MKNKERGLLGRAVRVARQRGVWRVRRVIEQFGRPLLILAQPFGRGGGRELIYAAFRSDVRFIRRDYSC